MEASDQNRTAIERMVSRVISAARKLGMIDEEVGLLFEAALLVEGIQLQPIQAPIQESPAPPERAPTASPQAGGERDIFPDVKMDPQDPSPPGEMIPEGEEGDDFMRQLQQAGLFGTQAPTQIRPPPLSKDDRTARGDVVKETRE